MSGGTMTAWPRLAGLCAAVSGGMIGVLVAVLALRITTGDTAGVLAALFGIALNALAAGFNIYTLGAQR